MSGDGFDTQAVGDWRLRGRLGRGAFAEVRYAVNKRTKQKAAIKICAKAKLTSVKMRSLLEREIATMKKLSHPNVMRLYEAIETDSEYYLVLELASGGELFERIRDRKRFDEHLAKNYMKQLVSGVNYCHAQGIVHRDLKPQNLLLTADDVLKVADFGFSNFQETDEDGEVIGTNRLKTQCGTPNYAAPEIFLGKGYDGRRTDAWSCGVILYVMLTGHAPFGYGSSALRDVVMCIVQGKYSMPESLPQGAQDLIRRTLVVDPAARMTLKQMVEHPWLQLGPVRVAKVEISEEDVERSIMMGIQGIDPDDEQSDEECGAAVDDAQAAAGCHGVLDALPLPGSPAAEKRVVSPSGRGAAAEAAAEAEERRRRFSVVSDERDYLGCRKDAPTASFAGDPAGRAARHDFQLVHWAAPQWCFHCGRAIYGVGAQGFACRRCNCAVHPRCLPGVSSTCEQYRRQRQGLAKKGRENWVPDDETTACQRCEAAFGKLTRRHHCRVCGGVFCSTCSADRVEFTPQSRQGEAGYKEKPKRVCVLCAEQVGAVGDEYKVLREKQRRAEEEGAAPPALKSDDAAAGGGGKKGRENWVADEQVEQCLRCRAKFTLIIRRHHCRACGGVFCGKCCAEKMVFTPESRQGEEGYKEKPKRLCIACADGHRRRRSFLSSQNPMQAAGGRQGSGSPVSAGSGSPTHLSPTGSPGRLSPDPRPTTGSPGRAGGTPPPAPL